MQQPENTSVNTSSDAADTATTARGTPRKRVALTPHRAEIEGWVAQGNSDEWIATALGTSRASVQSFRSRRGIKRREAAAGQEDDVGTEDGNAPAADEISVVEDPGENPAGASASEYEGVLDQGEEEGYGLWLDPAVADNPLFREGFAGVRDVRVVIERGRIILEPDPEAWQSSESEGEGQGAVDDEAARQLELITGSTGRAASADPGRSRDGEEVGRIKWFEKAKGYGFIFRPDGGEIFFHTSELTEVPAEALAEGRKVSYEVGRNSRGPIAKAVRLSG